MRAGVLTLGTPARLLRRQNMLVSYEERSRLNQLQLPYTDAVARTYAASPTTDNDEIGFPTVFR
jgi:hypothetical protein